ncbi:MAG: adenylate/guanylate cyclase domain-containing protein [Leptospiraceae bacterium]|nr:adenylate/guanylate cyclase domain-containing protein [Leptospiraceae bacterium]
MKRSRQKVKIHIYFGYYVVVISSSFITFYAGGLGSSYWAFLNFVLIFWLTLVPFSFLELSLHGLNFIFVYNVLLLYLVPHFDLPKFVEYNSLLLGTWLLGSTVAFINNRFSAVIFEAHNTIEKERHKSEGLLLNVLPAPIVTRLKNGEKQIADKIENVSVLFADIVNFTELSTRIPPEGLVALLNTIFSEFDTLTESFGLEKIKTIGDAYMVVGGLSFTNPDHTNAIADMALAMPKLVSSLANGEYVLDVRIGVHFGTVVAGIIGKKKFIYDLWGDTVNIASRMESHGLPGKIQVTETVYNKLQNHYTLKERGKLEIKGKGFMNTWWLEGKQN